MQLRSKSVSRKEALADEEKIIEYGAGELNEEGMINVQ